jgi:hypothetical protein
MPTFRHGKDTSVLVNEFDFSNYFNEATASLSVETSETTTFGGDGSKTYIVGLKDATASLSGLFEGSATGTDEEFATAIGTNDTLLTVGVEGGIGGRRSMVMRSISTSYEITSPVADVVSISAELQAEEDAIDYGIFLVDVDAITATTDGAARDNSASSANGLVAHLHVVENAHDDDAIFKIQHSADNSTWADLITFTTVPTTVVTSERSEATGTINRYLRAQATLAGTGSITYTIAAARR